MRKEVVLFWCLFFLFFFVFLFLLKKNQILHLLFAQLPRITPFPAFPKLDQEPDSRAC
jgi:hypothetical protein